MITIWAAEVTSDNHRALIEFAQNYNLNISDDLEDREINAEDGFETYLIFSYDGSFDSNCKFATMRSDDFQNRFRFTDMYHPLHFRGIERI